MKRFTLLAWLILLWGGDCRAGVIPEEPVEIGFGPQFVFDSYIVDSYWTIKRKREAVKRVFHPPVKHPGNPVMATDMPSYLWVLFDEKAGVFRMYYQANVRLAPDATKAGFYTTRICYAESRDGIEWQLPDLDLFPEETKEPNNVVLGFPGNPDARATGPSMINAPEEDRRGYRFLMQYRRAGAGGADENGIRVIGSKDGIHWDPASDTLVAHLHSDTYNTICHDPRRGEYVVYCRAKDIYLAFGEDYLDQGASRRIARMSSRDLWHDWMEETQPQTILVPDERDAEAAFNYFYAMPTRYHAGIYWGFLEPFRLNDFIYTELVWSRDGINFERLPDRPKLLEFGEEGSWDDEMIFASPSWVEVGDEWYFYYTGWNGPHGTPERDGAVGLAKVRKEGLLSRRGPAGGGVVATRRMIWPGGDLLVNTDASEGEMRVRVSDAKRKPLEGFDYDDGEIFTGDSTAHRVQWGNRGMEGLRGREIRLEFFLRDADLYTFRADR